MADKVPSTHDYANFPSKDRFTAVPILIMLALSAMFFSTAYASNNFQRLEALTFLTMLAGLVTAVMDIVFLTIHAVKRRWRNSISIAAALGILLFGTATRYEILSGIDWARFQIFRDYYVTALGSDADPASTKGPRILNWGFNGYFMTGEFYRKLVYDGTDEIGKPNGMDAARIRPAIQGTMENSLAYCRTFVRQIEGHYYLVDIACT
jgi:hypothetical protein